MISSSSRSSRDRRIGLMTLEYFEIGSSVGKILRRHLLMVGSIPMMVGSIPKAFDQRSG